MVTRCQILHLRKKKNRVFDWINSLAKGDRSFIRELGCRKFHDHVLDSQLDGTRNFKALHVPSDSRGTSGGCKETYSNLSNSAQIYEIRTQIRDMKQGDLAVTQCFNNLKTLWHELDLVSDVEWRCPTESVKYQQMLEKDRVIDFLAGLNREFDDVRGPLRRPNKTFAITL